MKMRHAGIPIALGFIAVICCAAAGAQDSETVRIVPLRFIERKPTVRFFRPINVRVNADSVRQAGNVQVRLFPGKTLQTVKRHWIGDTGTGCVILKSRVNPYDPTFVDPDVSLMAVDLTDLTCGTDGFYKQTSFVLVVESADTDSSPAFRIDRSQLDRYFEHAYEFTVEPTPRTSCRVVAPPRPADVAAATKAMKTPELQHIANLETRRQPCIKRVVK
jgi:hypothetical protein